MGLAVLELGSLMAMMGVVVAQQMSGMGVDYFLAAHAQQNNPGALAATAAQYQNQPNVLQSLLGNKGLMLAGLGWSQRR